ncbi:MAG: hypothetical protein E6I09_00320 [Chloroflexi bacterium]|nr:MAG: hypothetical protein E6I09_00320 [Chloroflexota bacterium]
MAAMIAPDTPPARRGPAPSATYEPSPASTPATAILVPHSGETAKSASPRCKRVSASSASSRSRSVGISP